MCPPAYAAIVPNHCCLEMVVIKGLVVRCGVFVDSWPPGFNMYTLTRCKNEHLLENCTYVCSSYPWGRGGERKTQRRGRGKVPKSTSLLFPLGGTQCTIPTYRSTHPLVTCAHAYIIVLSLTHNTLLPLGLSIARAHPSCREEWRIELEIYVGRRELRLTLTSPLTMRSEKARSGMMISSMGEKRRLESECVNWKI